jgi:hypothetical protein
VDGIERAQDVAKAIDELVNTHMDVRPGAPRYHRIPWSNDREVLIAEVPKNTYSLSMVTYKDANEFWIRRGWDNRPMTTDEIQYKFGRFEKVRQSAWDRLTQIREWLGRFVANSRSPYVWFAGVPLVRSRDSIPVNVEQIQKVLRDSSYFDEYPDRRNSSGWFPAVHAGHLLPSLHGMALKRSGSQSQHLEINRDGSMIYAIPVSMTGDTMTDMVISPIYEALASSPHAFLDLLDANGLSKAAILQGGLLKCGGKRLQQGEWYLSDDLPVFSLPDIDLDALEVDETTEPRWVFLEWASQIANALEQTSLIQWPPWIGSAK